MRSVLAIWFSLLFLAQAFVPNGDLCCELQKIPNMVNHYLSHNAYDGDSFYQFLAEDFFDVGHDLNGGHDKQEHDNMPFHGNHQCAHAPIFIPTEIELELAQIIEIYTISFPLSITQEPSSFIETPFQPPKA